MKEGGGVCMCRRGVKIGRMGMEEEKGQQKMWGGGGGGGVGSNKRQMENRESELYSSLPSSSNLSSL